MSIISDHSSEMHPDETDMYSTLQFSDTDSDPDIARLAENHSELGTPKVEKGGLSLFKNLNKTLNKTEMFVNDAKLNGAPKDLFFSEQKHHRIKSNEPENSHARVMIPSDENPF